jgi:hypothetical protein
MDLKLPAMERRSVLDVQQLFHHKRGRLTLSVVKLDQSLPHAVSADARSLQTADSSTQLLQRQHSHLAAAVKEALAYADVGLGGAAEGGDDRQILMWS